MSLLGLPVELICRILEESDPRAFESLALACKRIYQCAEDQLLERHNALCRSYRHFCYSHVDVLDSAIFLRRIILDPKIAAFVETADLFMDEYGPSLTREALSELIDCDVFRGLIAEGPLFNRYLELPNKLDEMWDEDAVSVGMVLTLILLSLLPNIRRLTLPGNFEELLDLTGNSDSYKQDIRWQMLDEIARSTRNYDGRDHGLAKLQTVYSVNFPHEDVSHVGLQAMTPFLLLPAVVELRADRCVANDWSKPLTWQYWPHASNLRKVELASSSIDTAEITAFLQFCPNIHSFKFSHESGYDEIGTHWDANACLDAIIEHCSTNLTDLALTVDHIRGDIKGGFRSLKAFTALKALELDARLFFGPEVTASPRQISPTKYRNHAYDIGWNGLALPNLSAVLPSTIQEVRFVAGSSREDILILKGLFAKLKLQGNTYFPRLQRVRVSRGTQVVGSQVLVPQNPSMAAWRSVREHVEAAGAMYDETMRVRASWIKDYLDG